MKEKAEQTELIELAIKKMAKEASAIDLARLGVLLNEHPDNQSIYDQHVQAWELAEKARGISMAEVDMEWKRLDNAIDNLDRVKPTFSILKIAAVVMLLLASSFLTYQFFLKTDHTEIIAATLMEQQLADGSNVTLHPNAQLRYPKDYNKHKREVALSGEAFFEVQPDDKKPFVIHAQNSDITVLGTSFNVKAEEESSVMEVVVVTGKVQVSYQSNEVILLPGEKGLVNKRSGKIFKIQNDDPNFQSWKTKKFVFQDLPLVDVIALLSNVYEQPIYLKSNQLKSCPVTVTFDNQSFESVMRVLSSTLNLTVEKSDKGFRIDGEGCE